MMMMLNVFNFSSVDAINLRHLHTIIEDLILEMLQIIAGNDREADDDDDTS